MLANVLKAMVNRLFKPYIIKLVIALLLFWTFLKVEKKNGRAHLVEHFSNKFSVFK